MTKKIAVLSLLLASVAFAGKLLSFSSLQNLTGVAPTVATDGLALNGADFYQVTVAAAASQTITGGTLVCYRSSAALALWYPCGAGFTLTPGTGNRVWTSPPIATTGIGRVKYVPTAMTVSGGTQVTVLHEALSN